MKKVLFFVMLAILTFIPVFTNAWAYVPSEKEREVAAEIEKQFAQLWVQEQEYVVYELIDFKRNNRLTSTARFLISFVEQLFENSLWVKK